MTTKIRDFLFAIIDDVSESYANGFIVCIGTRKYWEQEGCLNEYWEEEEIEVLQPVLDQLGLSEASESQYEHVGKIERGELRLALWFSGLEEDAEFQKYMEE